MHRVMVAFASLLIAGCAIHRMAVDRIGDTIAAGGTTYATDDDPDLVGEALPFSLKLIESLLADTPRHRGLLLAATSGFTQYSYGWVDLRASEAQTTDLAESQRLEGRARRLYLRARDYGLRGLSASIPGFDTTLRTDPARAVARAGPGDVALLYWTSSAWALAIARSKHDPESVADLPLVEAMIRRAEALDPDFESGAIDSLLIAWEASQERHDAARAHFERAVKLSNGQLASPFVALAENVAIAAQRRTEFRELLERALAIDSAARPEWRLQNLLAQRHAAWLLAHADDYFLEEEQP